MVRIRARNGSRAVEHVRGGKREDGKASYYGIEGGDFGRFERSKREGNVRGKSLLNRLP